MSQPLYNRMSPEQMIKTILTNSLKIDWSYQLEGWSKEMNEEPLTPIDNEYDTRSNQLHIKSEGPQGGEYTLTVDFDERTVLHSSGHPPNLNRKFDCPVEDLKILSYEPVCEI